MSTKIPLVKVGGKQNHNLYKRIDVYWIRFYRAGKGRIEESLKTNILTDARIARDKRIAEFLGEKVRFSGKGILVEDKFPEFLELKKSKAEGTFEANERSWRIHLKPAFGHMLIQDVTETSWMMWVIQARSESPGRKFFNERKTLQNFLNWLSTEGAIARRPILEDVDPEINAGKIYSSTEIKALLENARGPMALQIRMGAEMMMRHGEIWSLEWSQVDLERRLIHLPAQKTKIRRSRTFAISEAVFVALKALEEKKSSNWVFPSESDLTKPAGRDSSNNHWVKTKKAAKVSGRFHDLRHTGLTNAFKNAVNPALICDFAGLSLEEAQKTYLHLTPEDTRVVASLFKTEV